MAIYTAIATATSLVGISFFGAVTELANENTSVLGIGFVFVLLGVGAAWFSRQITGASASEREAITLSGVPIPCAVTQDPAS